MAASKSVKFAAALALAIAVQASLCNGFGFEVQHEMPFGEFAPAARHAVHCAFKRNHRCHHGHRHVAAVVARDNLAAGSGRLGASLSCL